MCVWRSRDLWLGALGRAGVCVEKCCRDCGVKRLAGRRDCRLGRSLSSRTRGRWFTSNNGKHGPLCATASSRHQTACIVFHRGTVYTTCHHLLQGSPPASLSKIASRQPCPWPEPARTNTRPRFLEVTKRAPTRQPPCRPPQSNNKRRTRTRKFSSASARNGESHLLVAHSY
jgi:hypothetical protein